MTTQLIQEFAQAIQTYLRLNDEYRRSRNPQNKGHLKTARNQAYVIAQQKNAGLHTHLNTFKEPDFLRLQARELIARWDHRNDVFENLTHHQNTPGIAWHETAKDKIDRLDKAEKRLRDHLRIITEIISKLQ